MEIIIKQIITSLLRHGLTYFGADKFVSSTEFDKAVGAILFLGGLSWSIYKGIKDAKGKKQIGTPVGMIAFLFLPFLLTGCVMQRAVAFNADTKETVKYTGVAWFNNTAVKGLNVGKKTKTTSNLFSLEEGANEVQTEALKAMAEGLATGAVKGAVPVP